MLCYEVFCLAFKWNASPTHPSKTSFHILDRARDSILGSRA